MAICGSLAADQESRDIASFNFSRVATLATPSARFSFPTVVYSS